jgi:hypothetical protein
MNDQPTLLEKLQALSPTDLQKVSEFVTTGEIPAEDREDFSAYQSKLKRCAFCGKLLRPLAPRSRQTYCDNRCKMRAYRQRKAR